MCHIQPVSGQRSHGKYLHWQSTGAEEWKGRERGEKLTEGETEKVPQEYKDGGGERKREEVEEKMATERWN